MPDIRSEKVKGDLAIFGKRRRRILEIGRPEMLLLPFRVAVPKQESQSNPSVQVGQRTRAADMHPSTRPRIKDTPGSREDENPTGRGGTEKVGFRPGLRGGVRNSKAHKFNLYKTEVPPKKADVTAGVTLSERTEERRGEDGGKGSRHKRCKFRGTG